MNSRQLAKLRKDVEAFHNKIIAGGGKMTKYLCPHCHKQVPTRRPTKDDVTDKGYWDSLKACFECGELAVVMSYPSGRCVAYVPVESVR